MMYNVFYVYLLLFSFLFLSLSLSFGPPSSLSAQHPTENSSSLYVDSSPKIFKRVERQSR